MADGIIWLLSIILLHYYQSNRIKIYDGTQCILQRESLMILLLMKACGRVEFSKWLESTQKKSTLWSSKCFGIVNCHCELKLHARIIIKTTWPKILFYQHKIPYSSWWSRSLEKYISKFGIYKYFIVFIFRLKICIFVYRCTVTAIHNLHAAGKHFSYNKFNQI